MPISRGIDPYVKPNMGACLPVFWGKLDSHATSQKYNKSGQSKTNPVTRFYWKCCNEFGQYLDVVHVYPDASIHRETTSPSKALKSDTSNNHKSWVISGALSSNHGLLYNSPIVQWSSPSKLKDFRIRKPNLPHNLGAALKLFVHVLQPRAEDGTLQAEGGTNTLANPSKQQHNRSSINDMIKTRTE